MTTKVIFHRFLRCFVLAAAVFAGAHAGAATFYVSPNGSDTKTTGTNWAGAKRTIQEAINLATNAGDLVLVTNGIYATHGTNANLTDSLTNQVFINRPITVRSVNGPLVTTILGAYHPGATNGSQAVRCAYVGAGGVLSGFTLTNGATQAFHQDLNYINLTAGGVFCEDGGGSSVENCIITGNGGVLVGGAYGGALNRCILSKNVGFGFYFFDYGGANPGIGGARGCTLYNSLLVGNFGNEAGAVSSCSLYNCTVTGNTSTNSAVLAESQEVLNSIVYYNLGNTRQIRTNVDTSVSFTCTTPLMPGSGNFTNVPLFLSTNNNFRLGPNSPCVDVGAESMPGFADLDGQPRLHRKMDLGCYERQIPGDVNNDGLVNAVDLNGLLTNYSTTVDQAAVSTVLSNYWPSRLLVNMTNVAGVGSTQVTFALTNSNAGAYSVEYSTNLVNWQPLGAALPRYVFNDTNAAGGPTRYYRLSFP